jgi:hypothetical protein
LLFILALSACVLPATAAPGQTGGVRFTFDPTAILGVPQEAPDETANADDPSTATLDDTVENVRIIDPFGTKGTWRWTIQGGGGVDWTDSGNTMALLGGGFSYFFVEGLSINAEFNGMFFSQADTKDAGGFNFNLLLRWHFIRERNWSIFVDGGAGLLLTVNEVPQFGSSFNFTPQAGVGATIALSDNVRLIGGARWQHVSNAGLYDINPGLDHVMGWIGFSVGF